MIRCQDQSPRYGIATNVLSNLRVRCRVYDPDFRKTLLPDWGFYAQFPAGAERESAFDELDRFLNADLTVERFHGTLEQARRRRGLLVPELHQQWLDEFREEYNQVRPHEALGMKTPASVWSPSPRRYHPNPPEWEYGSGSEVERLGPHGQLKLEGRWWQVCEALAGEAVQLERARGRVLVYYCQTLLREIDLVESRSTALPPSLRSAGNAVDLEKV